MAYSVAVVGGSGYAGAELLRLLAAHPEFEIGSIAANTKVGQLVAAVHPQLQALANSEFTAIEAADLSAHDLVFFALPHGASASIIRGLPAHSRVVDLGADFRLQSSAKWQNYYGTDIPHAGTWTYGLPELAAVGEIAASDKVANPGCYATLIALAAAPLISANLVVADDLVCVAASGTSGAGRTPTERLMASEVIGSMSAYKVGGKHQHTPEIEQTLQKFSKSQVRLSLTPVLAPMTRGILATLTAKLTGISDIYQLFVDFYADHHFVQVLPKGQQPRTAAVYGSNFVQLQVEVDEHTQRVVVTGVLDNLVKGAAGQAIQNANLMFGLSQSTGLNQQGVTP